MSANDMQAGWETTEEPGRSLRRATAGFRPVNPDQPVLTRFDVSLIVLTVHLGAKGAAAFLRITRRTYSRRLYEHLMVEWHAETFAHLVAKTYRWLGRYYLTLGRTAP